MNSIASLTLPLGTSSSNQHLVGENWVFVRWVFLNLIAVALIAGKRRFGWWVAAGISVFARRFAGFVGDGVGAERLEKRVWGRERRCGRGGSEGERVVGCGSTLEMRRRRENGVPCLVD